MVEGPTLGLLVDEAAWEVAFCTTKVESRKHNVVEQGDDIFIEKIN